MMFAVNPRIQIPMSEFEFSFARSSGPGGQNVNKVNSKALLRWNIVESKSLPEDVLARFIEKFQSRLTGEGELVIQSDRFRDQLRNQEDCLEKLRSLLLEVAVPPKLRRKTKPSRSAKKKRVESKKKHSEKKMSRSKPSW